MRDETEIGLKAFTANPAGIDRDAILFAAGRAAGNGAGKWKAAASLLAATQATTLALVFWPPGITAPPDRAVPPIAARAAEDCPAPPEPFSLLALRRRGDTELDLPEFEAGDGTPPEPTWTPMTKPEAIQ